MNLVMTDNAGNQTVIPNAWISQYVALNDSGGFHAATLKCAFAIMIGLLVIAGIFIMAALAAAAICAATSGILCAIAIVAIAAAAAYAIHQVMLDMGRACGGG